MSRVPTEINEAQLKALMRMKPTLQDTAAFFECSGRTIERHIKEAYDLTFVEFREQHMVHTKFDLIRMAIQKAEKSDTMHIFCLKNLCGWRDKHQDEVTQVIQSNENNPITDELLKKLVGSAKGNK